MGEPQKLQFLYCEPDALWAWFRPMETQGLALWVTFLWNCLDPSLGSHNWTGEVWCKKRASQVVLVIKNPPVIEGDVVDLDSIPGLGIVPGGGHGNPLQYSWLGNPMDRGAWQATIHRVKASNTLKWLSRQAEHLGLCSTTPKPVLYSPGTQLLSPHAAATEIPVR